MQKIDLMEAAGTAFGAAADYMRGWNDAVDAMPRWISVEERLPEESEDVVLIVVNGSYKNAIFHNALQLGVYYESCGWIVDMYPEWEDAQVTHWMPLPQPPEEGES